jgi:hypothetical protein
MPSGVPQPPSRRWPDRLLHAATVAATPPPSLRRAATVIPTPPDSLRHAAAVASPPWRTAPARCNGRLDLVPHAAARRKRHRVEILLTPARAVANRGVRDHGSSVDDDRGVAVARSPFPFSNQETVMQKPRTTDGTVPHRRHARYHMDALAAGNTNLHTQLAAEMAQRYAGLKTAARATEDAEDDWMGASARTDAAEIDLENAVRHLDTELVRADEKDATLNAQRTVFPKGFGPVISPDGEEQLGTLPALYKRVEVFTSIPEVGKAVDEVETAETVFRKRLGEEAVALEIVSGTFAAEQEARRHVREQLDSAYGRLRDLYKGRPAKAEQFFYKDSKRKQPAKTPAPEPTPKPA